MEKVLIVDDSILNATVLARILASEFEIHLALDGESGMAQALAIQPDLILLDVILPGMSGFEVMERLRRTPATQDIPIIILTGQDTPFNEEYALRCGAVDYVTKPFREAVIRARVRTHVELYHYRKEVERMALLDGLTQIPNRRSFDQQVKRMWERAKRENQPFSAALTDIDDFKKYNDHYGHLPGDNIIRAVALTIYQTVTPLGGFAARFGGEEFAFLLPGLALDQAQGTGESLCRTIESFGIPHAASTVRPVLTISIGGVTLTPEYTDTVESLLSQVDKCLYQAKDSGRNHVCWKSLPEQTQTYEK